MEELSKAVVLEALRQKLAPDENPDVFFGTVPMRKLQEAGLSGEIWKSQLCESGNHRRYVLYVRPGEKVVTACYKCMHRKIQHLQHREETARFLRHLENHGTHVPEMMKRSLKFFL